MTDETAALTLDCIGLYCPEPLFQTRESIDSIEIGEVLEVFADDPAAEEDLTRFAKRAGHEVVALERDVDQLPSCAGSSRTRHRRRGPARDRKEHDEDEKTHLSTCRPRPARAPVLAARPRAERQAMDLEPAVYYLGRAQGARRAPPTQMQLVGPRAPAMPQDHGDGHHRLRARRVKQMLGWDTVELRDGVKIVGAATLNDLALDADSTMWF
jgi:TusA-related sulfurtransferase